MIKCSLENIIGSFIQENIFYNLKQISVIFFILMISQYLPSYYNSEDSDKDRNNYSIQEGKGQFKKLLHFST